MNESSGSGREPVIEMFERALASRPEAVAAGRRILARRGLWGLGLGLLFYDARLLRGAR